MVSTDKRQEFNDILRSIGAKSIIWSQYHSWNKFYKSPDSLQSDLIDLDIACKRYRFLREANDWQKLIKERLSTWNDSSTLRFEYNEDYGINDETIDILMEKLEATNRERIDLLGEMYQTRSTDNLSRNLVYKLFTGIHDTVRITFFSKEEYKIANRMWVKKHWGSLHICAYLKVIGLSQYCHVFKEKSVEGHALLELGTPEILMQTFWMSSQDATTLAACINDLGDLDSISILAEVSNEVDSIRSGGESSQKTESLTDSIANFFGVKNQTESFCTTHGFIDMNKSRGKGQITCDGTERNNSNFSTNGGDGQQKSRLIDQGPLVGNVSIITPSLKDEKNSEEWIDSSGESELYSADCEESDDSFLSSNYHPRSTGFASKFDHQEKYSNSTNHSLGGKESSHSYDDNDIYDSNDEDRDCRLDGNIFTHVANGGSSYGDVSDETSFIGEKQEVYKIKNHEETDGDRRSTSFCESDYSESISSRSKDLDSSRRYWYGLERKKSQSKNLRRQKGRSRRIREVVNGDNYEDEEMAYKVVMVGIVGVGKKSLMKRFGGAEFSSSEITKMSKHFVSSDVERYMIKTWDDKGQKVQEKLIENRRSILPFTKKADVLMVVYDITNVLSFKYLPDILEQIISSGTTPWMSLVLVGNKVDLDWVDGARQVSSDMAFDLCRRYGFGLNFETSAKIGTNVTELLSVALSRCEQDRVRELSYRLKNDCVQVINENFVEQPTFAQNIASFFGIGAGARSNVNRSVGDVDSADGETRRELMSIKDDANTQYSSRFGPTSYSSYAGKMLLKLLRQMLSSFTYVFMVFIHVNFFFNSGR